MEFQQYEWKLDVYLGSVCEKKAYNLVRYMSKGVLMVRFTMT